MRFSENVAHWFGRAELIAFGAESAHRNARDCLDRGDPLGARLHAKSLLERVPGSKIGLSLLAEASEAASLVEDAAEALVELAEAMPHRAEPWLRLAFAREAAGYPGVGEALERAASATEGWEARRLAWLMLCDRALEADDPALASRWLDRVPNSYADAGCLLRMAEIALAAGNIEDAERAYRELEALGPASAVDGRRALVLGRIRARRDEPSALDPLLRAFILEARGASAALANYLGSCRDALVVDRARRIVGAAGEGENPRFVAAFALAEGRREDAARALREGASGGNADSARALLDLALGEHEPRSLEIALRLHRELGLSAPSWADSLSSALDQKARGRDRAALDELDAIPEGPGASFRDALRREIFAGWLSEQAGANWPDLLIELSRAAEALGLSPMLPAIEAIAMDRERPLRVAILGEFNAGKSSFLNALLGADVAPTGILPTTAVVHRLVWAADEYARIALRHAPARVVSHERLKHVLKELSASGAKIDGVTIHAPIELLRSVEFLDTPGQNSPDPSHGESALSALDAAHLAFWLLDANQPLKESERARLAEIAGVGLPVMVMLSKGDRLSDAQLEGALLHVREGLEMAQLASYREPFAFSTRSLDDQAGWGAVLELLEVIAAEGALLRERASRRKARLIVDALLERAGERAEREARREAEARDLSEELSRAAARMEGGGEEVVSIWEEALRQPIEALKADLKPISNLSGELSEAALRYAVDRAILRLSGPLALAGFRATRLSDERESEIVALFSGEARALVAGAMAVGEAGAWARSEARHLIVAASLVFARSLREEAARNRPPMPASVLVERLESLQAELRCSRTQSSRSAGPWS